MKRPRRPMDITPVILREAKDATELVSLLEQAQKIAKRLYPGSEIVLKLPDLPGERTP